MTHCWLKERQHTAPLSGIFTTMAHHAGRKLWAILHNYKVSLIRGPSSLGLDCLHRVGRVFELVLVILSYVYLLFRLSGQVSDRHCER
jgi:hypothetical protein